MRTPRWLRSRAALAAALLADVVLFGGPHRPDVAAEASLQAALDARARVTDDWMTLDGVVGTAVGLDAAGRHVVKVYLTRPGVVALPALIGDVGVVPEVMGPVVALGDLDPADGDRAGVAVAGPVDGEVAGPVDGKAPPTGSALSVVPPWAASADEDDGVDRRRGFPRPVPIGVSTGHPDVSAGTIGARVTDGVRVYALSNNHVYAASNGGRPGDNLLQPGVADGGRDPEDALGTLHDFEPIRFCRGVVCPGNRIDAAVALTTPGDLDRVTPEDGYGSPRPRPVDAELGMVVQKYGRTTGHTKGRVSGIHATIDVQYRNGTARFEDQVVITGRGFSTGGDSGSLIVTDGTLLGDRRPVALLFAGSSSGTIANPIGPVLDRFGVRVDGEWR